MTKLKKQKSSEETLESYIHLSKYSRFLDKECRRETWEETVDRIISFWHSQVDKMDLDEEVKKEIHKVIG